MPKGILIDEVHLTFTASRRLARAKQDAIARTLSGKPFRTLLRRAIAGVVKRFPSLRAARFSVSR
jgi:hypothetical protein